jgi:VIT1/CCC1 family predicted Fe2+/Mn2+ transporter
MAKEKHNPEHVFEEKERIEKLSLIREIVFGAQDGLLVPLGVVSSVAGAFSNNHIVIVAGIAEALAGAFSMGTGAFLASQAEKQVHDSEIKKEKHAIEKFPEDEKKELVMLYMNQGLEEVDAKVIVERLFKSKTAFTNTHIREELGLDPDPVGTPINDAMFVGFSYLFAAVIPIAPYFVLPAATAVFYSIVLTLIALFSIGLLKAKFAQLSYIRSGLQVMFIGSFSGIGGYILGFILPRLLGIK